MEVINTILLVVGIILLAFLAYILIVESNRKFEKMLNEKIKKRSEDAKKKDWQDPTEDYHDYPKKFRA